MDTQAKGKFASGQLFVVATPIGNLKDITFRAVEVLREVDLIAAEDTRTSYRLLRHYQIDTPMLAYHAHNEERMGKRLLTQLSQGKKIALISDAGTPLINDPGHLLLRRLHQAGIRITPIPGACSPIAALSACAFPCEHFSYLGFLPRRGGKREAALRQIETTEHTLILLETPHRIIATLKDLQTRGMGRELCIAREMTKLHEEFHYGTAESLTQHFSLRPPRGEMVLIIGPKKNTDDAPIDDAQILQYAAQPEYAELSPSARARNIAKRLGIDRARVYHVLLEAQRGKTSKP